MAFVPMEPPPMMPDDLEDDDEFDQNLEEEEDEDSNSYDLTGLSEKLHSIPKEAIQITPKEAVLPNQNGISVENVSSTKPTVNNEPLNVIENSHKPEDLNHIDETNENSCEAFDEERQMKDTSEPEEVIPDDTIPDIPKDDCHINGDSELPEYDIETSEPVEELQPSENELKRDFNSFSEKTNEVGDIREEFGEEIKSPPDEQVSTHEHPEKVESESSGDDNCHLDEKVIEEDDDEFGNFDSSDQVPEEIEPVKSDPNVEDCGDDDDDDFGAFEDAPKVPPLTLDDSEQVNEFGAEDDDDFGDFTDDQKVVKPETGAPSFASAAGWASLDSSPRGKLDQILIQLQLKLTTVISSLYLSLDSPEEDENRVQALDFDRDDCEDRVWHLIHNIQSTPALNQKWKDTEGRSRLLTLLKVDPRNVSQNDVPIAKVIKTSNHSVPAFASGLGVTLEPSKIETVEPKKNPPEPTKPSTSKQPDSLVNSASSVPSAPQPEMLKPTFGASLLPNEEDFKGDSKKSTVTKKKEKKGRSSAAQTIIDSFPLLDFMQSPILSLEAVKK